MALSAPFLLFDPTDDFLLFDNLEVVQYLSRQPGETFTDPEVKCLARRGDVNEPDESGIEVQTFHVRPVDLTYPAKPRDEIVRSDGTVWVVNVVDLETFGVRYRLVCTRTRRLLLALTDDAGVVLDDNVLSGITSG